MKRAWLLSLGLCAMAIGCSGGSSGSSNPATSPSPTPAPAATTTTSTTTYTVPLAASNEVPAISNAESAVTGTASIALRATKDGSGTVTSATVDFTVNASGLTSGSSLTMAHIHRGAAGAAGSIVVDTGLSPGGAPVSGGSASFQRMGVNVAPDVAQAVLSSPGGYYFNVHSAANPGGVARGQLDGSSGGGGGGGGDSGTPAPPAY